jgi:hypothetical protein
MVEQQPPREVYVRKARRVLALQIEELHVAKCVTQDSIVELRLVLALRADLPLEFYQDTQKAELILGPVALECKILTRRLLALYINRSDEPKLAERANPILVTADAVDTATHRSQFTRTPLRGEPKSGLEPPGLVRR